MSCGGICSDERMSDNPLIAPVDAEGNQAVNGARARYTTKAEFGNSPGGNESDEDEAIDRRQNVGGAIVPIGNIDDTEVYAEKTSKPLQKEKKNSKWGGKGESLTTETALQFMIKERAMMELESAKLKRENDELRRGLDRGRPQPASAKSADSGERPSDEALLEELKKVRHENEKLKMRQIAEGAVTVGAPPGGAFPAPPVSGGLVQKGPLRGPAGMGLSSYSSGKSSRPELPPPREEPALTIAARLWDGGYLWKIPYNGKGAAEKRIVALKRAKVYPSPGSRAVIINREGKIGSPDNFIVFPPTLVWYNSDKPGEVKNARELILYEGSCLIEGHNTNAFHKLVSRDKPVPRAELCFSLMTSTRSLDLASETVGHLPPFATVIIPPD